MAIFPSYLTYMSLYLTKILASYEPTVSVSN